MTFLILHTIGFILPLHDNGYTYALCKCAKIMSHPLEKNVFLEFLGMLTFFYLFLFLIFGLSFLYHTINRHCRYKYILLYVVRFIRGTTSIIFWSLVNGLNNTEREQRTPLIYFEWRAITTYINGYSSCVQINF